MAKIVIPGVVEAKVRVQLGSATKTARFHIPSTYSVDELCQALGEGLGGLSPAWKDVAKRGAKKGKAK